MKIIQKVMIILDFSKKTVINSNNIINIASIYKVSEINVMALMEKNFSVTIHPFDTIILSFFKKL